MRRIDALRTWAISEGMDPDHDRDRCPVCGHEALGWAMWIMYEAHPNLPMLCNIPLYEDDDEVWPKSSGCRETGEAGFRQMFALAEAVFRNNTIRRDGRWLRIFDTPTNRKMILEVFGIDVEGMPPTDVIKIKMHVTKDGVKFENAEAMP